ncbi:MAG: cytochrome C oxidase subunit III [Bacteroidetes bacterium HGW-Bacteroidetes-11]|jgi:cytochrome c oxidase subunit 3|nr:MAG: cytochrome C oxidase subunit III [Bacteroidetes bacterium HGW-Bacteroidetes-11]
METITTPHHADAHRDDTAAKLGMWLFIFTEILLFGGLFIVYSVYRFKNPVAFELAHHELSITMGLINTIILLVSSATVAISISAMQKNDKKMTMLMLGITLLLALVFLVNKYFEWGGKFEHGMYPGSELMKNLSNGDMLFFSLYFFMTGLHAVHIIVGMILLAITLVKVKTGAVNTGKYALLENSGLYWHLVDLIWIFLFPLFYLIH